MNKKNLVLVLMLSLTASFTWADAPAQVVMPAESTALIAKGVGVPAGRAYFWTSGTGPTVIKKDGATTYERMGDTYSQGSLLCRTSKKF
ncbi:MAG TPA: hypothetical protein VKC60_04715 [Opitutaceae bacterium]|nr:hypothetical protein [Opitutaceae bacterium]